jgi:branched-chain amino acid transport system substrate-binding protein
MKGEILSEAYANGVLDNTEARAAVDGDYVGAQINFSTPNAAVKSMLATIKKYDPAFHGIPDLGLWSGYVSADAMILGLQRAGTDPTQSSFIKNLRKVTDYTAGGILPEPTTFAHFGTAQMLGKSANCIVYVRLQGSKYVPVNGGTPVCGKLITVPSSALTS